MRLSTAESPTRERSARRCAELLGNKQVVEDEERWVLREGPTEAEGLSRRRLGKDFFRRTVLVSYDCRCCITGTPIPALLSASHIVAWSADRDQRLNPRNGLCLAKTRDAAFDRHLITLDKDLRVVLSNSIRDHFMSESVRMNFQAYEWKRITLPRRFTPDPTLLQRHRELFEHPAADAVESPMHGLRARLRRRLAGSALLARTSITKDTSLK